MRIPGPDGLKETPICDNRDVKRGNLYAEKDQIGPAIRLTRPSAAGRVRSLSFPIKGKEDHASNGVAR